jgi:hypothetical protein
MTSPIRRHVGNQKDLKVHSTLAPGFTLNLPQNISLHVIGGTAAITSGVNTITLPNMENGDEVTILSQYGVSELVINAPNGSILPGPAVVTSLAAGQPVKYIKSGLNYLCSVGGSGGGGGGGGSSSGLNPTACPAAVGGVITLPFASSGNIWYACTISANTTFAISGGTTTSLQEIRMEIIQNSTGGFSVTLPSSSSSPAVLWPGGVQPTPVTTANSINIFKVSTTTVSGKLVGSY